ncbi:hypothetical protein M409DRAFT_28184 [Zasmidium cellare ATCC 36951]|uniref:SMP-30/Gluconolactonase/LRE-like region domain-containing protein n=1 Tax=Zasmidium cellare ATCC 36951 TaxID=1080233 RepID=A0A6A6C2X4_ZASCE|nr:uncharacterized protein M409DRAFT_28184 [Zasmidium cellare ATCC 36951]KAF2161454.1 hypothetical protein M409DRAFT_28184 [Zasmidium cellare ATCC 36951]
MLLSHYILRALGSAATAQATTLLPVHNITHAPVRFENLAVRSNGQILTTTTSPNASVYLVDPLGILPTTLIHTVPNVSSATGIAEGKIEDVFYFVSGTINITTPNVTFPETYSITEIDVRGVSILPNGTLTNNPRVKRVASLPGASLPNGVAFAGPDSDHILTADSFHGLIWNIDVCSGELGVTLNDSSTKGVALSGQAFTGINGLKVQDGIMYWTNTGASKMYKVAVDDVGRVRDGQTPTLVTSDLTCDDLVIDCKGNAYVAGPRDVLTRVYPNGEKEIVAGTYNSTTSSLVGPTAVRFGRLESDRWSLYITTNGGVGQNVVGTEGIYRVDLGAVA